jgi:solute carrier family 35 protein F1/2
MRGFALPTTQTWFLYFSLFITYTPYTIYKYGFKGWGRMILKDGWKYFFLAAADVEGNFLVVKAFQSTNLLSAMLLDTWAIPVCMLFTWIYLRTKFHWSQYLGVFICCIGMGLLVYSDQTHNYADGPGTSIWVGDVFMLAGATLYGFTNATEEFLVRNAPLYQVVGQLGMWGMIINGIQASALEHDGMVVAPWNSKIAGLLVAYTVAMYILYTVAPILYRMASSTYFNLSILSSDFYGLCFGMVLYGLKPFWLYFLAFVITLSGLVVYFWHTAPEEGKVNSAIPAYVDKKMPVEDLEASSAPGTKN